MGQFDNRTDSNDGKKMSKVGSKQEEMGAVVPEIAGPPKPAKQDQAAADEAATISLPDEYNLTMKQFLFAEELLRNPFKPASHIYIEVFEDEKAARQLTNKKSRKYVYEKVGKIIRNPSVAGYLKARKADIMQQTAISVGRTLQEVSALAFSNMNNYITRDDKGKVGFKTEWPDHEAAAISRIKIVDWENPYRQVKDDNGENKYRTTGTKLELHLHDKKGPLELLMRYLGMLDNEKDAHKHRPINIQMNYGDSAINKAKGQ